MKLRPFLAVLGVSALSSASALAFDVVTVGVGAQFQGGAIGMFKPDDQTASDGLGPEEYPGFAGSSLGGGGFIDIRFRDYVGIDFGVYHMTDKGRANIKLRDAMSGATTGDFDVTLKQAALHMPLMVKGVIPGIVANTVFFIGPEFVVPLPKCRAEDADRATNSDCNAEVTLNSGGVNATYGIQSTTYTQLAGGFGVEFKLPIPGVDLRIPFGVRFGYTPGVSDKRDDREKHLVNGGSLRVEYETKWQIQGHATVGAAAYF